MEDLTKLSNTDKISN